MLTSSQKYLYVWLALRASEAVKSCGIIVITYFVGGAVAWISQVMGYRFLIGLML
jgi:hypothetical protein